jgi:multisubunit Na+/H+ antiporter MnhG subunit
MLYLWTLCGAIVAVASFVFAVVSFMSGKLLLGFAFFILAAVAAVVAASAYYAKGRVDSVREFFGLSS